MSTAASSILYLTTLLLHASLIQHSCDIFFVKMNLYAQNAALKRPTIRTILKRDEGKMHLFLPPTRPLTSWEKGGGRRMARAAPSRLSVAVAPPQHQHICLCTGVLMESTYERVSSKIGFNILVRLNLLLHFHHCRYFRHFRQNSLG